MVFGVRHKHQTGTEDQDRTQGEDGQDPAARVFTGWPSRNYLLKSWSGWTAPAGLLTLLSVVHGEKGAILDGGNDLKHLWGTEGKIFFARLGVTGA